MTTTDHTPAAPDGLTATTVLDRLRDQLREPAADDMQLLLKINSDLSQLDAQRWSPTAADAWTGRPETAREYIRASLGRQKGFKLGLAIGFAAGFLLSALFAGMVALHWMVANQ
jgi:hypothetical protein